MTTYFRGNPPTAESVGALPIGGGVLTGSLTIPAGTQGAPSLNFTGDPNTGIYSPGADIVAFTTGGSEKLRASSSGPSFVGNLLPIASGQSNIGGTGQEIRHTQVESVVQVPIQISSNGSFTDQDPDEIYMDATAGNLTAQVTMGSTSSGKRFLFKKTDASANTVTVSLSAGTIDGAASVILAAQYDWVELRIINATTAYIISRNP